MKLIVGLGNPGSQYEHTRHNIGFRFLNFYAANNEKNVFKRKFDGLYCDFLLDGEKVILLFPLLYMNLSGIVVKKYIDYFNVSFDDILIIQDDLDMDFGKIKLVRNSSSGGHNGIKNIEENLATNSIKRLKFGISNDKERDTKDFVLGKFSDDELLVLKEKDKLVADIINDFIKIDYDSLMAKYNGNK